jgi:coenzyme F420-0:L-glutamate ligase / coenzyme F420-1:gamma-L-glutamate ligase
VTIEVLPVEGLPEVGVGTDLVAMLADPLGALAVRDADVVVVTQKIVSKAEGRIVPGDDRAPWIERETARVVARRGDLVIAETRHGFVCANAGVDASNVEAGTLALLPDDPDASAEALRSGLKAALGVSVGVVVTDTFGRAWREGLVNVALGVAGLPALVDLRGTRDHTGRELDATVVALADEIAAASGLVTGKAARIPVAIVRGATTSGAPPGRGHDLVRRSADDLFRESPLQALHARRTIRSFGPGDVPRTALEEAVRAACTAPAPHHTRPWRFTALTSRPARRALLAAMAEAWRADLRGDGVAEEVISRRIAKSDAVLGLAPALIVPWVSFDGGHRYEDAERAHAEQEMFLLSGGAAIQNLLLALHAQSFASCWISSTLFCQQETRAVLGMDERWYALGVVACGPMPEDGTVRPRPPLELDEVLRVLD